MIGHQFMDELQHLPDYLGHHLLLSITAILAGIIVCLPLACLVTRVKPLQWPVLTFASVLQTIPGMALLALMVPLLGQIGFLPALIALFLYSLLPILRNTVTGILGVDPALTEAARGIGMTSMQMLIQVEFPMALSFIIAGIRTAAVWVVGTATLATPVGATSLGNYIFSGLQTQNAGAVLIGCVAAGGLAIVIDQLIRLVEVAAAKRSMPLAVAAAAGLLALIGGGISPVLLKAKSPHWPAAAVVVGAKTFTEQYILADLLVGQLQSAEIPAISKASLGSTVVFDALATGEIDCYVDYTGTIWANMMKRSDIVPAKVVLEEMTRWLQEKYGIVVAGPLGFENTYSLAMRRNDAAELRVRSIADLAAVAPTLSIGSDYEFFSRPEWVALRDTYQLKFSRQRTFDPSLMYKAIHEKTVDVISAYSTDGRIVDYDLVVLEDPKQALPPYDAVLLLSKRASQKRNTVEALRPLVGQIDNQTIRQANKLVDVDRKSVAEAAAFVRKNIRVMR